MRRTTEVVERGEGAAADEDDAAEGERNTLVEGSEGPGDDRADEHGE